MERKMDFLTEHWLSVGVGVFWLSMVLYGHYRGLVRICCDDVSFDIKPDCDAGGNAWCHSSIK